METSFGKEFFNSLGVAYAARATWIGNIGVAVELSY